MDLIFLQFCSIISDVTVHYFLINKMICCDKAKVFGIGLDRINNLR